ncbi:glycosyltransferase [Ferriphaselus sp. R-1]|uniref:glycosyltransferase n=1 Tax=Ferriphaselus sp. R-1 TaxID=1485544 RepID=UPI00068E0A97|nr:glycosyltransferase [Ferriphaselus sp. R-1]
MSTLAPIVVFAYRRPDHLRNTLESLKQCEGFSDSPVIVYCDGPRNAAEVSLVEATRKVAKELLGDGAEYHFSEENRGLSRSVITGVSETLERFGRAVVVEDDLELNPGFLRYMNEALDRYADEEQVFQISGYMFDVPEFSKVQQAMFMPFTVSWGWGTWKRAWDHFDSNATGWEAVRTDAVLRKRFNLEGVYDYATMLIRQMEGLRDSWAIRWYWAVFRENGLVLFPPVTLVSNKGFDGSGSHGRGWFRGFSVKKNFSKVGSIALPLATRLDLEQYRKVTSTMWRQNGGWVTTILDRLRRKFGS